MAEETNSEVDRKNSQLPDGEKPGMKSAAAEVISTKDDIKKIFDESFASNVNYIYLNSIDKELGFKEITVMQQKQLSRIMVANEKRKDIVYDAQCQLLNKVCTAEGFDIYGLTEFERLKLLIALYQANMFASDVKFTCKNCGAENMYKFNFDGVISKLDEIDVSPRQFKYENRNFAFDFTIAYPTVRTVSDFHRSYCQRHKVVSKEQMKVDDSMSNMEYVNLYVQKVDLTNKNGGTKKSVDFRNFKASDIEEIIQQFPQDVMYSDTGVLKYIIENYIKVINDSFEKHACYQCGAVNEEGDVNSAESFF